MRLVLAVLVVALAVPASAQARTARLPESSLHYRVRTAPVSRSWNPVMWTYTGGYYGVDHVNRLWPRAPRGPRRDIVLLEAVRHRVPFRLLLGVWGAESSFGRAASHFGLTGYFPGRGTSGSFAWDAHLAAQLLNRLYRGRYGRHSL